MSVLCNNAKVGVSVSFSFFLLSGGGGGRKNSGCLRGGGRVQIKMKATQGGVYKIHIWTITHSSDPLQVINTDWSLIILHAELFGLCLS